MVKRLRHRPFTAVTGVQIPLESLPKNLLDFKGAQFLIGQEVFREYADVAQLAEQLICNQQVIGSSPIVGFMDGFPSGQRGQTVNLLQIASVVRIHHHPFNLISRGGAARKLAGLITRRSQVQILSPQLKCPDSSVGRAED